jgi:hypothetical protein
MRIVLQSIEQVTCRGRTTLISPFDSLLTTSTCTKRPVCLTLRYVCPEPVLTKTIIFSTKRRQKGVSRTAALAGFPGSRTLSGFVITS